MDSDLSLDFLRVVEQAAIACAHTMGQGDRHKSDQVAVEAMRRELDTVPIDGTIVIGEGERDEAPMLYIGEKVGTARSAKAARDGDCPEVDIAVDPLEGTNLCATGAPNALAVLAASDAGRPAARARPLHGEAGRRPELEARRRPRRAGADNLRAIAGCLGRDVEDLVVIVLDRPRHEKLIADIRATGARIRLIRRRRSVRRHRRGRRRQRRACGDGHRRRARGRADRRGDALPERRDLRAPGRHEARARRALPRDGHHRLQEGSTRSKDLASGRRHHLRRDRRHRRRR